MTDLPRGRCEEHGGRDLAACDHGVTAVVNERGTEILVVDPARLGEFLEEVNRQAAEVTSENAEPCTAEDPDHPGLTCNLAVHGSDVDHYALGYRWPVQVHSFAFEAWPPDATERTLPGRTPRQMAASPKEAREAAQAWLTAANGPGWTVGAGIHNRYACQPPHGGRDV